MNRIFPGSVWWLLIGVPLLVTGACALPVVRTPEIERLILPQNADTSASTYSLSPDTKTALTRGSLYNAPFMLQNRDSNAPARPLETWQGHLAFPQYSPDGRLLAGISQEWNPVVLVWDAQSGKLLDARPQEHGYSDGAMAWSSDSRELVTASTDSNGFARVDLWDVAETGQLTLHHRFEHKVRDSLPLAAALSANGMRLALGTRNGEFVVWNVAEGEVVGLWKNPAKFLADYPRGWRFDVQLLFTSPSTLLTRTEVNYDGGRFGEVLVWNIAHGSLKFRVAAEPTGSLALSPDGKLLASAQVKIWNAANGALLGGEDSPLD
jgi:WD40 repeat protein